jgi:hypothetical protein
MICILRRSLVLIVLCLLMALLTGALSAQDATREASPITATEAAPLATKDVAAPVSVDSGGGAVTINTGSALTAGSPAPSSETQPPWWAVIGTGLITLIVLCGTGLRLADKILTTAMHDPFKVTVAEQLGGSVPAVVVHKINDTLAAALALIGDLQSALKEATDKQPYMLKTPEERDAAWPPAKGPMESSITPGAIDPSAITSAMKHASDQSAG